MSVHQLESTDAFYVIDFTGAPAAGIVRCAKKILRDGAESFARSQTYAFASFDIEMSGASAGINAIGDGRDAAVEAFVTEVAARDGAPLHLSPGKGVTADDLAALTNGAGAPLPADEHAASVAASAVAAAGAAINLVGATVAIDLDDALGAALADAAKLAGATVAANGAEALTADADVVFVGSKPAAIGHEDVESVGANVIVPVLHKAVTTRAFSTARRADITVLPDFICTSGPTLERWGDTARDKIDERVAPAIAEVLGHDEGPVFGACERAEAFITTWQDEIPFGRPV